MRIPGIAGTTGIEDLFTELTELIADDEGKTYWWILGNEAMVTFFIKKHHFYLKMPLPIICSFYQRKPEQEEIDRMRKIWGNFLDSFKTKLEEVNNGASIPNVFNDGITIDEKYGLEYKGRLVRIDKHTVATRK